MAGPVPSTREEEKLLKVSLLAAEIRAYCAAHADPTYAVADARWVKEGYDAYGLPPGTLGPKEAEWLAAYRDEFGLEGFLDLADILFASGKWEEGFLAIRYVNEFDKEFDRETFGRIGRWFEIGVYNWVTCDTICTQLLKRFFQKHIVSLLDLAPWRESPFKYQRRAVPVAMRALLNQKDYEPLLDFLKPLVADRQEVVQKAVGGLLRDAWRKQPQAVEAFLEEWKDMAPKQMLKYATAKMAPDRKAHFLNGK